MQPRRDGITARSSPPGSPLYTPARTSEVPLHQEVAQALVGDVDPERLEGFRFATGILPVFDLVRSLFSQNQLDTCLKLMVLHELSRAGGRSTIERVRSMVSFLDPGRVDSLLRSLREGGWVELRASDNTYVPSIVGVNLLSLLAAADLGNLSPQNALARAAQNAEFGATLDGGRSPLSLLLDQLHVLIEDRVDEARAVLQIGRPARMIAWAQQQHAAQLDTIRGVLATLADRLDAASRELSRVVRLHQVLQELVRAHTSIHSRLKDWNLERLYSADSGYSLSQLAEAVMGAEDDALDGAILSGGLQAPPLGVSLATDEVRARFHGARRRLDGDVATFAYEPPPSAVAEPLVAADLEPAAALRSQLTALFAGRVEPLELADWLPAAGLGAASWQLALICRLERDGASFRLDDGRRVAVRLPDLIPRGVAAGGVVSWLEERGAMIALGDSRWSRVVLALVEV